jgi:hypothetical protein
MPQQSKGGDYYSKGYIIIAAKKLRLLGSIEQEGLISC